MKQLILFGLVLSSGLGSAADEVVYPRNASPLLKQAASEVRRYVYLVSGELLIIRTDLSDSSGPSVA